MLGFNYAFSQEGDKSYREPVDVFRIDRVDLTLCLGDYVWRQVWNCLQKLSVHYSYTFNKVKNGTTGKQNVSVSVRSVCWNVLGYANEAFVPAKTHNYYKSPVSDWKRKQYREARDTKDVVLLWWTTAEWHKSSKVCFYFHENTFRAEDKSMTAEMISLPWRRRQRNPVLYWGRSTRILFQTENQIEKDVGWHGRI